MMKGTISGGLVLALAALSGAQTFSYSFEGLSAGSIVGQDGWTLLAGDGTPRIDNAVFSPMGGSTQSLRMEGGAASTVVRRAMGMTFNTGVKRVGYDMWHSPRGDSGNLVMSTVYYHNSTTTQIFQPYAQNGGGAGAAQNAFTDLDGLGGAAYGGTSWINATLTPETWYRLEFDMDFDAKRIRNGTVYDISSGTKVFFAGSPAEFYFNNDGTNWFDQLDMFGVRLAGQAVPTHGWNIDNFEVVPEPATIGTLALGFLALVRRRRNRQS